ncbi:MAG TPA: hypothetical protein VJ927_05345 [Actinomycetota bacterium]|nr:hypothetical protein [Actinomycetota bacterium]
MKSRSIRSLAVLASAGLLVGAFTAAPADAAKRKKKKPPACAAFVPPETVGEAEVVKLTDAATEEAPVEVAASLGPGVGAGRDPGGEGAHVSHAFVPVQVDSAVSGAGIYGRVEFTEIFDYDLYLDDAAGTNLMASGGFGPIDDSQLGGDANNSETGLGFEAIYGITTEDCGGYVFDIVGATTPGGDVTLKLWLGEATL